MAELADLDRRFARIEAALADAAEALEAADAATQARPDHSGALRDSEAELGAARKRIEELERDARDREAMPGEPMPDDAMATAEAGDGSDGTGRVAELEARVASLRAARAEDLSEMKALLAELELLVEGAHA